MMVEEKRLAIRNKYREIIGRNKYSQAKRAYCFKKYSDGKYYSDCSSSVSYSYKEAGFSFGILNTVGMYNSSKFADVPVTIKNGLIQNPEILRIGDMLLFAGSDKSRKSAGYVGHVEMVGEIGNGKVTLYGHGSGNPKKTELNTLCKKRYNTKTSTPLGRKVLIKVKRFIQDGKEPDPGDTLKTHVRIITTSVNVRSKPSTSGSKLGVAKKGDLLTYLGTESNGWYSVRFGNADGWVSSKNGAYAELE